MDTLYESSMMNAKMINRFEAEYSFLSNFYMEPCGISNEHRFQAAKAKDNPELRADILSAPSPGKAKRLGRMVQMSVQWWNKERNKVMKDGLKTKFSNPMLRDLLLQTDDAMLIEGNQWHDNYWGICGCNKCNKTGALGHNVLGIMLMQLRDELREMYEKREAQELAYMEADEKGDDNG